MNVVSLKLKKVSNTYNFEIYVVGCVDQLYGPMIRKFSILTVVSDNKKNRIERSKHVYVFIEILLNFPHFYIFYFLFFMLELSNIWWRRSWHACYVNVNSNKNFDFCIIHPLNIT